MNILELIEKKKYGKELTEEEISYFVDGYTINKTIPDYQASALLMAMFTKGLSTYETFFLTKAFVDRSVKYDFKKDYEEQLLVDKHSSGGVGDKVTLILAPILASFNIRMIKISGRGLGHTGGTIDKLESIKVNTHLNQKQISKLQKKSNCLILSQTDDLVPSDKMIYALRDVTGTVDSYGLIAASILSKKFVINSDYIFIDMKVGSGALLKTKKEAIKLANLMVDVARLMKRTIYVNITHMDNPIGRAIGNYNEIIEAVDFLSGQEISSDLKNLIYEFTANILLKTNELGNKKAAFKAIDEKINSGDALKCFYKWIRAQEGSYTSKPLTTKYHYNIKAKDNGFLKFNDTKELGIIACLLGAGRLNKTDKINPYAGIYLHKKTNDLIKKNDLIATLFSNKPIEKDIIQRFQKNIEYNKKPKKIKKVIIKSI